MNHARAGTQVLVAGGIYQETVSFPASGNAGNWIQVKAEGNDAILDGSDQLTGKIWTPHPSRGHVWFTKIGSAISYLARDQKRYYKYDTLPGLLNSAGHSGVTMKEGWYFEPSTLRLYIRSLDDPSGHTWQVPRLNPDGSLDTSTFGTNGKGTVTTPLANFQNSSGTGLNGSRNNATAPSRSCWLI